MIFAKSGLLKNFSDFYFEPTVQDNVAGPLLRRRLRM